MKQQVFILLLAAAVFGSGFPYSNHGIDPTKATPKCDFAEISAEDASNSERLKDIISQQNPFVLTNAIKAFSWHFDEFRYTANDQYRDQIKVDPFVQAFRRLSGKYASRGCELGEYLDAITGKGSKGAASSNAQGYCCSPKDLATASLPSFPYLGDIGKAVSFLETGLAGSANMWVIPAESGVVAERTGSVLYFFSSSISDHANDVEQPSNHKTTNLAEITAYLLPPEETDPPQSLFRSSATIQELIQEKQKRSNCFAKGMGVESRCRSPHSYLQCNLEAGDILFVPDGWLHSLVSAHHAAFLVKIESTEYGEKRTANALALRDQAMHLNAARLDAKSYQLQLKAIETARHSVSCKDIALDVEVLLGVAEEARGNERSALTHYITASSIASRTPEAFFLQGRLLNAMGKPTAAVRSLQTATELHPDCSYYQRELGASFANMQDYNQALNQLQKSLVLNPYDLTTLRLLAHTLLQLQRLEEGRKEAELCCELADKKGMKHEEALCRVILAKIDEKSGDWKRAERNYGLAIELNPFDLSFSHEKITFYRKIVSAKQGTALLSDSLSSLKTNILVSTNTFIERTMDLEMSEARKGKRADRAKTMAYLKEAYDLLNAVHINDAGKMKSFENQLRGHMDTLNKIDRNMISVFDQEQKEKMQQLKRDIFTRAKRQADKAKASKNTL